MTVDAAYRMTPFKRDDIVVNVLGHRGIIVRVLNSLSVKVRYDNRQTGIAYKSALRTGGRP